MSDGDEQRERGNNMKGKTERETKKERQRKRERGIDGNINDRNT